jgi:hypothetical protein
MRASARFAFGAVMLALTIASTSYAAAKCPNRFFKKVPVKGFGDTQPNAQTAYDNDMAKKIAAAKPDCDKLECEDSDTEACTFLATEKKKAACTQQGAGWKCTGWMRPGCFCQEPDEEIK